MLTSVYTYILTYIQQSHTLYHHQLCCSFVAGFPNSCMNPVVTSAMASPQIEHSSPLTSHSQCSIFHEWILQKIIESGLVLVPQNIITSTIFYIQKNKYGKNCLKQTMFTLLLTYQNKAKVIVILFIKLKNALIHVADIMLKIFCLKSI